MLRDFIGLFYPNNCAGCGQVLLKHESHICTSCKVKMPRTNFSNDSINPINKLFVGKVPVSAATAMFSFTKGGIVQNVMHELKYKGNQKAGEELGRMLGSMLSEMEDFKSIDYIIPVPMHPKKLKVRGYNQCDSICRGANEQMNAHLLLNGLVKSVHAESQTRKSKYERWKNVESIFELNPKEPIEGGRVLIIDDVVTTGSTLEACCHAVLKAPNTSVCIATVAYA